MTTLKSFIFIDKILKLITKLLMQKQEVQTLLSEETGQATWGHHSSLHQPLPYKSHFPFPVMGDFVLLCSMCLFFVCWLVFFFFQSFKEINQINFIYYVLNLDRSSLDIFINRTYRSGYNQVNPYLEEQPCVRNIKIIYVNLQIL